MYFRFGLCGFSPTSEKPPLRELNMTTAGPLRSTGVTPLPHYYGPLRLPTNQLTELCIALLPPGYEPQPVGPLRFLDLSFATRHPLPPRWADPLHLLVASRGVLASSLSTDWPPITCVSRLNPVQPYGLRLTASLSSGLPPSPKHLHSDRSRFPCFVTSARQTAATYLTSNYMATSFQIAGKARLNLTHQKTLKFIAMYRSLPPVITVAASFLIKSENYPLHYGFQNIQTVKP